MQNCRIWKEKRKRSDFEKIGFWKYLLKIDKIQKRKPSSPNVYSVFTEKSLINLKANNSNDLPQR